MRKRGGDSNNKYVSIIATHQARIRCLLSDILGKKIERFMNGAVLRLEFFRNENQKHVMSCTLVHQGELDPTEKKSDRKYYVTDTSVSVDHFIPEKFPEIKNVDDTYVKDGNNYVFFLIRHGQGVHNTLKGMKKLRGDKNPELTDKGVDQAKRTGNAMKDDPEFQEAKYLFSSDLTRTIQTLVNVVNQSDTIVNNVGGKIVVLPCSHELNYDNKGSCDGSSKQMFTGNENKTSCKSITDCIQEYEGFNINWNFYTDFYGKGTRLNPGKKRNRCRNANFLEEATKIIKRSGEMFDANVEMYPRRDRAATIDNVDEETGPRRLERSLTFGGKKRKTRKRKQLKRKRKTHKRKRKNKNKKRTRKRGKSIRKRKRTRSRK